MNDLQARLARLQADLDSLNADVAVCSSAHGGIHTNLNNVQKGVDELLEKGVAAREAVDEAREGVKEAQGKLRSASTEITRALSRPAPFLEAKLCKGVEGAVCGIVSTLRDVAKDELRTWLSHHLDGYRFHVVFLFFDDPSELEFSVDALAHWGDRIVAVPVDHNLQPEYEACRRLPELKDKLREDWLARQELHVEIAMRWSLKQGCEWLLHIDLDEVFITLAGALPAPLHYAGVDPGTDTVAYVNHEGVPEVGMDTIEMALERNRFEAITLFRRNPHCLVDGIGLDDVMIGDAAVDFTQTRGSAWEHRLENLAISTPNSACPLGVHNEAVCALAFWARRTKSILGSAQYFLAYGNGKGAVRLSSDVLPNTVHRFGTSNLGQYWSPMEAAILHYAHAGIQATENKFQRLRKSTGQWWRSFVLYEKGREMRGSEFSAIYRGAIALADHREAERQVQAGICLRYRVEDRHLPKCCLYELD